MKIRHPALIRSLSAVTAWVARGWIGTLDVAVDDHQSGPQPFDPRVQRCIYAYWHETMLFSIWFRHVPAHILISQHADGELIAQVAQRFGVGVVRGSSRRRGSAALLEMLRLDGGSHLVVTPDGPSGPRREVKPGVVFLASQLGLPIVPVGVGFTRAWRAPSWDRFVVPWPFSGVRCVAGPLIHVPKQIDTNQREDYRRLVEQRLLAVTDMAEAWAESREPRALADKDRSLAA